MGAALFLYNFPQQQLPAFITSFYSIAPNNRHLYCTVKHTEQYSTKAEKPILVNLYSQTSAFD